MNPKYMLIGNPKDKMIEEMGEVLQALGKAERFGYFNSDPEHKTARTNIEQLKYELGDLEIAIRGLRSYLHHKVFTEMGAKS